MASTRALSRGYPDADRGTPRKAAVAARARSGSLPLRSRVGENRRPSTPRATTPIRASSPRGSSPATRAELCANLRTLEDEKDHLQVLTQRQRDELRALDDECRRLRACAAEADLAKANIACETYATKCAADNARFDLWNLEAESRRLESELAAFHEGAARLRQQRELAARLGTERSAWYAERRQLEQELATARDNLAAVEHSAMLQDEELTNAARRQASETAELARQRSDLLRQREEAAQQRRLWEEADAQRRLAQRREEAEAERGKLGQVRGKLDLESEARHRQAVELQASMAELERSRKDLHSVNADNAHLRACLQQSLRGLERIQEQSRNAALLSQGLPHTGAMISERSIAASPLSAIPRLT